MVADVAKEGVPAWLRDDARVDQLIITGGAKGGGAARAEAVEAANGKYVAFLDDDDEWMPAKIAAQVAKADAAGSHRVVVATSLEMWSSEMETTALCPRDPYVAGPVEDYLFRRRLPSLERASLYTSTLLSSLALAREVNWATDLRRHQDWDWILRLQRAGADIQHIHEPLVRIQLGSAGSISASPNWAASLDWVRNVGIGAWDRRTVADFIAAQPLRYALQARSIAGVMRCLGLLARNRRLPSLGPAVFAMSGVLPRRVAERAALKRSRSRNRVSV